MHKDYKSGNHQFEADFYVASGTTGACVMQVFGGITNATSGARAESRFRNIKYWVK